MVWLIGAGLLWLALKKDWLAWLLITMGTGVWGLVMIKNGVMYEYGLGFWGPHAHDAVWHLSLIEHLSQSWDTQLPIAAGERLQNYHYGYDVFQALVHRVTRIPNLILYFQILPLTAGYLLGWLSYVMVRLLSGQLFDDETETVRLARWLSLLMIYLGGSAGWLVSWYRGMGWGGESMFWAQQAISSLINPPFVWSVIGLLAGGWFWYRYREGQRWYGVGIILLWGLLVQVKVYGAVLVLFGWGMLLVWELLRDVVVAGQRFDYQKWLMEVGVLLLTTLLGFVSIWPFSNFGEQTFIWQPGWFFESMLTSPDRFYSPRLWHIWLSETWWKSTVGFGMVFVLFIVGNLWIRVVGLGYMLMSMIKQWKSDEVWLTQWWMIVVLTSMVLPLLLIQNGTAWNTIQFMYYGLFGLCLFTGLVLARMLVSRSIAWKWIVIGLVIGLQLPTLLGTLQIYLHRQPSAIVTNGELEALHWLAEQPGERVLEPVFKTWTGGSEMMPLHGYVSTGYVSMLSGKQVYLEDEVNLEIIGVDWESRRGEIDRLWRELDGDTVAAWLDENQIDYVYLPADTDLPVSWHQWPVTMVYTNTEVSIFKVNSIR